MPGRKLPLVSDEYYHVFNRGINRQSTFLSKKDYLRALTSLYYYQSSTPPLKLSLFLLKTKSDQTQILKQIATQKKLVDIIAYCLMPNHFHLLIKQNIDNGISKYLANFQNSYVKYFNAKYKRTGSLFERQFKAVHIETQEQLLHLSRYIHLNPYSSHLINKKSLFTYPYSSLPQYLNPRTQSKLDLSSIPNLESYQQFILDHADYQRQIEKIKHLTLESDRF